MNAIAPLGGVTFMVESWDSYYNDPERKTLWDLHYAEFVPAHENRMPIGPDVKMYAALDVGGALSVVVARYRGKMIGYCISIIRRHIHYDAVCGFEDSYYLHPAYRRGRIGQQLISAALDEMRRRGAQRAYFMTKLFLNVGKLFERLGGKPIDALYAFWL